MPPNRPACTPAAPSRRSRGIVSQMEKGGDHFLPPKIKSWPSVGRSSVINSALCVSIFIYFFFGGESLQPAKMDLSNLPNSIYVHQDLRTPTPPPRVCGTPGERTLAWIACLMQHAYSCVPGLLSFQLRIQAFVTPIFSVTSRRKANLLPFLFTGSITALLSLALKLVIYPHITL